MKNIKKDQQQRALDYWQQIAYQNMSPDSLFAKYWNKK